MKEKWERKPTGVKVSIVVGLLLLSVGLVYIVNNMNTEEAYESKYIGTKPEKESVLIVEEQIPFEERKKGFNENIWTPKFEKEVAEPFEEIFDRYTMLYKESKKISRETPVDYATQGKARELKMKVWNTKNKCEQIPVPNFLYQEQYKAFELCRMTLVKYLDSLEREYTVEDGHFGYSSVNNHDGRLANDLATIYGVILKTTNQPTDSLYEKILKKSFRGKTIDDFVYPPYAKRALCVLNLSDIDTIKNHEYSWSGRYDRLLQIFYKKDVSEYSTRYSIPGGAAEKFGIELYYKNKGLTYEDINID